MSTQSVVRRLIMAVVALALVAIPAPAFAQNGSLKGKVVDANGKGVDAAELTLDFKGDYVRQFKVLTDKNGEWIRAGMPSGGGTWTINVKKGDQVGYKAGVTVVIGVMTRIDDIVLGAPGAAGRAAPTSMSAEEVKKRNDRQLALEKLFTEANAAIASNNYDEAISKLTTMTTEVEKCAACFAKLGEVYSKKGDVDNAEKAFLKAIELDEKMVDAYNALATIYNGQKKFDDALKMSTKASDLAGAGGAGAAGGGDATSVYNQGIIMWNAGKQAEALANFERASKLDPKMADAHFWYGMALVNAGKLAEAKAPLQEYMKLAPTGPNAATAKALLDSIK